MTEKYSNSKQDIRSLRMADPAIRPLRVVDPGIRSLHKPHNPLYFEQINEDNSLLYKVLFKIKDRAPQKFREKLQTHVGRAGRPEAGTYMIHENHCDSYTLWRSTLTILIISAYTYLHATYCARV